MENFFIPFEEQLQTRIAKMAITRSSLRNQGEPGLINHSREHASRIKLKALQKAWNGLKYHQLLDRETDKLLLRFPASVQHQFGTARKALNLFFRDIMSHTYFIQTLQLKVGLKYLNQLELPMDSYTAKGIIRSFPDMKAHWSGVKYLGKEENNLFQQKALLIAAHNKIQRVQLDVYWWREDQ